MGADSILAGKASQPSKRPDLRLETRADGTIIIAQTAQLPPYSRAITARFMHWANLGPDRLWMAERDQDGEWKRITYGEAARAIRSIGSALLSKGLSVERPLLILTNNSIAHALMALGAQHVGIPSAALSPAYALAGEDRGKLISVVEQLTPGLVFADHAERFLPAIRAVLERDVGLVSITGQADDRETLSFEALVATEASEAADSAHARVGPETVAKFLFTSGTTGSPKAVIQTQGMLCSNQAMVAAAYEFLTYEPPVIVDWAPWNHTASGNKVFNMAIYNGGSYYIDDGRPTPDMIGRTIRNLREIAPTWYFNVPLGYQFLLDAMEGDESLADQFFSRMRMLMYAGAGMSEAVWNRLTKLAEKKVSGGVPIVSGLGATETGPFALYYTEKKEKPGNIGIPALGVTLKLVPQEDKLEARLKSPSITPGYWRNEKLTADAFDEEGFYKLGDALRFAVPGSPDEGFIFDGRLAENFKLATGTWVAVGQLRANLVNSLGGMASDAVIAGPEKDDLRALIIPNWTAIREISGEPDASHEDLARMEKVRATLQERLSQHAIAATGSASRVVAAILLSEPLSFEKGEVTDKGSVNQRAVLRERADLVEALYGGGASVVMASWKGRR
ncbi:feruloyl-CoA synthase (plasmid) [Peteryoungia desertarenae]|uniref:Feruloyl-CoA synthase n=1 Tax=Peteryoungia desertarenae TaxID=1813451 RepID=A0ABX6QTM5_9HYPH|nr:feruloyl-CoA synthase [Peteryoungia desertarenae]QLF71913.1 feruloyl-CoA synthase [Peteryoungia desertarenae]